MSIKKVLKESSNYFWGEGLVMASSFISFPILTRILTKDQYGIMALLAVTTTTVGGLASLGLNHKSLVRFYLQFKKAEKLQELVSSMFIVSLSVQIIGLIVTVGIAWLCLRFEIISINFFSLLPIALAVVTLQNLFLLLNTLHRMDANIVKYNIYSIIKQYSTMIAAVSFVLIYQNLYSFYFSQLAVLVLIVCFLILHFEKTIGFLFKKIISKPIIKEAIWYGFPLALSGICAIVFNLGDRYVIAYFLNAEHVASYSVAFSLCNFFKEIVITSINLSLMPMTYKLWEQKKIEQIKLTLYNILKYYYMIVIPVVGILILIPREIITVIASIKYIDAAPVLPLILLGLVVDFDFPFSAGLHLKKKTSKILLIISMLSLTNIALNCLLVPRLGIKGAACATLICGFLLIFCFYIVSRKELPINIPFLSIAKYMIVAGLTHIILVVFSNALFFHTDLLKIISCSALYTIIYLSLLVLFDADIRRLGVKTARRFFA